MHHKFTDNFKAVSAVLPQVLTDDSAADAVDTLGHDLVVIQFHIGNSADTLSGSVKIECEVQDGATSTTAACADDALDATVTGTNTGTVAVIDAPAEDSRIVTAQYVGGKRYIKPVINLTGTHTSGTPCAVTVLLGNPRVAPAV
jgi:hypothetical protein